jgi:isocitrate/isopropylmalate dehydrogenase
VDVALLLEALGAALRPEALLPGLIGLVVGIVLGALPGIGPPIAVTLLLPFSLFMPTAPALLGKDIANPMAMILAAAALLHYAGELGHDGAHTASRAVYESVLEATATGVRTPDLGGHASTSEFTGEVIGRVRTKIDIWASL